jgi:diketogulonate reductase-like aldo/keto reductase
MEEWWELAGGHGVQTNQLLYNLTRRGIEWDFLPWLRERRIPVMAYSPLEQARLLKNAKFAAYAKAQGMTPAQLALAWLLANDDVIAIPKSANRRKGRARWKCSEALESRASRLHMGRQTRRPSPAVFCCPLLLLPLARTDPS